MRIDILTLFPDMFAGPFSESIIKRAQEKGLVQLSTHNIRDWANNKHNTVDDEPYGGGPGMVMKVDVVHRALESVVDSATPKKRGVRKILFTPKGRKFDQRVAQELLQYKRLVFVCGHYEGIDYRFNNYIDEELSIGDFVLTGGELPAMVVTDALIRLIPGVVGNYNSVQEESFSTGILDHPHYTRPREYDKMRVPEVLLSGHAKKIEEWRKNKAMELTVENRPDLIKK